MFYVLCVFWLSCKTLYQSTHGGHGGQHTQSAAHAAGE